MVGFPKVKTVCICFGLQHSIVSSLSEKDAVTFMQTIIDLSLKCWSDAIFHISERLL